MLSKRHNPLLVTFLLLALGVSLFGLTAALTTFYKVVTSNGAVDYTSEVTFTDLVVQSPSKIKVTLTSNSTTVAGYNYTIKLYDDGTQIASSTVSWTAGQIPGTSKATTFTGLSLVNTTNLIAEVDK